MKRVFIVGGAGCIGSHFCDYLLQHKGVEQVTVFDNFSSGKSWHLAQHENERRLRVIKGEVADFAFLGESMSGHETIIHLASNPDISRAVTEPTIDFDQGTKLTQNVVEAMRVTGAKRILYASGSGVYGDAGFVEVGEDYGPLIPISTYGASKLAGEALISSFCYMFDLSGLAFRFGNVVGPRQTHGVGFDFINKLKINSKELPILGDGKQSKSYVHISDIINGVFLANQKIETGFAAFNIATGDYITVEEIAQIAIKKVLGPSAQVKLVFSGGDRGWKGDIPIVRLNTDKIRSLGWQCKYSSAQAMELSIDQMLKEMRYVPASKEA